MTDETQRRQPSVVVHPPLAGRRPITIHGDEAGAARGPAELREMLRRAGLTEEDAAIDDPELIDWRGGGPDYWPGD
jgi:hypothetical protein